MKANSASCTRRLSAPSKRKILLKLRRAIWPLVILLTGTTMTAGHAVAGALGPTVGGSLGTDWINESDMHSSDVGLRLRVGDTGQRNHFRIALVHTSGRVKDDSPYGGNADNFRGYAFNGAVAWPLSRSPGKTVWIAPALYLSTVEFRKANSRGTGYGLAVALGADYFVSSRHTFVIEGGLRHVCLDVEESATGLGLDHDLVELTASASLLWGE